MRKNELRYVVTIDVRAAYDEIQIRLADLVRDHREEILRLLDQLRQQDIHTVEEQVYKQIVLDLCPRCQKAYIADPLHFQSTVQPAADPVDIDAFLRSLGFGGTHEKP